jgi:ferritin
MVQNKSIKNLHKFGGRIMNMLTKVSEDSYSITDSPIEFDKYKNNMITFMKEVSTGINRFIVSKNYQSLNEKIEFLQMALSGKAYNVKDINRIAFSYKDAMLFNFLDIYVETMNLFYYMRDDKSFSEYFKSISFTHVRNNLHEMLMAFEFYLGKVEYSIILDKELSERIYNQLICEEPVLMGSVINPQIEAEINTNSPHTALNAYLSYKNFVNQEDKYLSEQYNAVKILRDLYDRSFVLEVE